MPNTDPHREGGPCDHARKAAEDMSRAEAQYQAAPDEERAVALAAYQKAFDAYRKAQEECRKERMRSRR